VEHKDEPETSINVSGFLRIKKRWLNWKCIYIKFFSTIVRGLIKENFIQKFNRQSKLGSGLGQRI